MEAAPVKEERRLERRRAVNMPATIQAKLGLPKIECRVFDISASGAKIGLIDGEVPDDFVLCLNEQASVIRICKVVLREGSALGVKFVVQKKKTPDSRISRTGTQ